MFHPGKVVKVFSNEMGDVLSAEEDTHCMLSMWDENLLTVLVHENLKDQVKTGDLVLVDYRPISETLPIPRFIVSKILRGELAEETWKKYKEKYRALKGKPVPIISSQAPPMQAPHSYIG